MHTFEQSLDRVFELDGIAEKVATHTEGVLCELNKRREGSENNLEFHFDSKIVVK